MLIKTVITTILVAPGSGREFLSLTTTNEDHTGDNPRFYAQEVKSSNQKAVTKHLNTVNGALEGNAK